MRFLKGLGKVFAVIGVTLAGLLVACIVVIYIIEKGPSEQVKVEFVRSCKETSRMGFVGEMFLSKEEVENIMNSTNMVEIEEGEHSNTDLIIIKEEELTQDIEYKEVSGPSFKGHLLIIRDPSRVFCGTIPEFGNFQGMTVDKIIDSYNNGEHGTRADGSAYNVIAGVNGGDFPDAGANTSITGTPLGAVFSEGEVAYVQDSYDTPYHLAGFTNENKFIMGIMTVNEAISLGMRDAIYSAHETGPFLVMDGEALINDVPNAATYGGGCNPRTAVGQREDGAVLLLVVDGRQANSLGATFKDLAYCMLENGALNAAAFDGGTSSQMFYNGEMMNHPYAVTPRKCPTSWLVQ